MDAYATTSEAAKAIRVSATTLNRWVNEGKVTPAWTTPGGQHRWDIEDLKRQLRIKRRPY